MPLSQRAQRFSKSGEQRFVLPFIFRGALDVGATEINDAMQIACIDGIAELARATTSAEAAAAYQGETMNFGADYLIPKPFDPACRALFPLPWHRPPWTAASQNARSRISRPIAKRWIMQCLNRRC